MRQDLNRSGHVRKGRKNLGKVFFFFIEHAAIWAIGIRRGRLNRDSKHRRPGDTHDVRSSQ